MRAIIWDVTLGSPPTCEILFPRGDEDRDHLVATIELPLTVDRVEEARRAVRHLMEFASPEQWAEWRSNARPIDRASIADGPPPRP